MSKRKVRGRMKKMTDKDKRRRADRDKRKPPEAQHKIRLWAHQHIKGER